MILTLAILLLLATFSTKLSARLGVPGMVVFLLLGMIFGSDGLNIVQLDDPFLAQQLSSILLVFILFEGGFSTKKSLLGVAFKPAFSLATIGIVITAVTLGIASHLALGFDILHAILLGSIIASTDAAAVFAIFRNKNIQPKIAATLEIESASNDPAAIILTVAMIDLILGGAANPLAFIANLCWQIITGIGIGYLIGKTGPYLFNKAKLDTAGFYYVLILSVCCLSYGLADIIKGSGFLAVFMAGFWMGNSEFVFKQGITHFLEGIAVFSNVVLFIMLGLLVFPSEILAFWKEGIIIALLIIFVARPIAVFISTAPWKYSFKERIFLCWGGIKGSVPIVLATYPFVAGIDKGNFYFNVVFFVVIISALIQGSTIDFLAKKLNLLAGKKQFSPYSLELLALEESQCELIEYDVKKNSYLIGKQVRGIPLPKDSLINAIVRKNEIITPRGDTVIKEGDILFILVRYEYKEELLNILEEGWNNKEAKIDLV